MKYSDIEQLIKQTLLTNIKCHKSDLTAA